MLNIVELGSVSEMTKGFIVDPNSTFFDPNPVNGKITTLPVADPNPL